MAKKYNFTRRNPKTKRIENTGYMEIRNAAEGAELYIYGDIVSSEWQAWSSEDTYPQGIANFMKQIDNAEPLTIYINSGGGDVFAGIAIHSILSRHMGHKKGIVDGIAASIASVILMSCDEIVMSSGAQIMIHKPSSWAYGNADDFANLIDELDRCQQNMTDIYMKHVQDGVTEEIIKEKIDAETWMTAAEACEVFDINVEARPAAVACVSWMMDRYRHKPQGIQIQSVEDIEAEQTAAKEAEKEAAMIAEMELYGI